MGKDTQILTGADLLTRYPKGERMIQITYKKVSGISFDRNATIAPDILAQLDAKYLPGAKDKIARNPRKSYAKSTGGEIAQSVVFARNVSPEIAHNCAKEETQIAQVIAPIIAPKIAPVEIAQPAQAETSEGEISRNWRDVLADAICIGVVMFHAFLIAYDCATQWGTAGLIGGALAFAVQCLALLYATDNNKTRTSEWALLMVGLIDVAAWFVHSPTFQKAAELAKNGVSPIVTDIFAGALCLFSFTALYLYRDSKII